jgi:hypothetical protein
MRGLWRLWKTDPRAPFYVVGALSLLYLVPIWGAPYLVMQDVAGHVELGCELVGLWKNDPRFTDVLFVHPQPWANSLPSVLLGVIMLVVPGYTAMKLALSVYVILWPLSVALLLRSFGRSPWLALIALPTTLCMAWAFGFYNFLLAKPVWCLCLIATRRFAVQGGLRRGLELAALLVLLFLSHSLLWLLCLAQAPLIGVLKSPTLKRVLVGPWPFLLAGAISYPFFKATHVEGGEIKHWFTPGKAWDDAWSNLGMLNDGDGDERAWWLALAALVLVFCAAGARLWRETDRDRIALFLCACVAGYAYLYGPMAVPQASIIAQRVLVFGVVLLVASAPSPAVVVAPVMALVMTIATVVHVADTTRMYRGFSREEMGDFEALLAKAPKDGRLATMYTTPLSKWGRHAAMWHWPKLHCSTGHGYTDDVFAYRKQAFVELTPEARKRGFEVQSPGANPDRLKRFDALLLRGDERAIAPARPVLEKLGSTGTWHLYKVRKP